MYIYKPPNGFINYTVHFATGHHLHQNHNKTWTEFGSKNMHNIVFYRIFCTKSANCCSQNKSGTSCSTKQNRLKWRGARKVIFACVYLCTTCLFMSNFYACFVLVKERRRAKASSKLFFTQNFLSRKTELGTCMSSNWAKWVIWMIH